jgi:hypothetical protein
MEEINPYEDKPVAIFFTARVLYAGHNNAEYRNVIIKKWLRQGIILDDGTFVGWSTVSSIVPMDTDWVKEKLGDHD